MSWLAADMVAIRVLGRGGQGAQVGCHVLAEAFFQQGAWVQAFAAYGGERRGAPVTASLRVAAEPIRLRCDIESADYALVLDASLLQDVDPASLAERLVIVNAPAEPCSRMPGADRVVAIDATAIARRTGLGPIVATAMIGAFAGRTGLLPLAGLQAAVQARSPLKAAENVTACTLAYGALAAPAGTRVAHAR